MNHTNIFDDNIIHNFDFKDQYVGYVLDTSEFETNLTIKVFVPEIFGYAYNPSIKNIDYTVNISKSHIYNDNINFTTEVKKQEYIRARAILDRSQLTTKDDFLKAYKPNIGDKVLVSFFNNNPTNCIYENIIFASNGESFSLDDGTIYLTRPEIDESINKRNKTIVWKF